MPRTDIFDIESPLRSLSTVAKSNKGLLLFLIVLILFMVIYIPSRVFPEKNNDE